MVEDVSESMNYPVIGHMWYKIPKNKYPRFGANIPGIGPKTNEVSHGN